MKKLIIILFTFLYLNSFSQNWYEMRGPLWIKYQNGGVVDSVKIYFSGTNVSFSTSKQRFDFNKPVYIDSYLTLNGDINDVYSIWFANSSAGFTYDAGNVYVLDPAVNSGAPTPFRSFLEENDTLNNSTSRKLATKYELSQINLTETDPVWINDSARYISKSQARSDIHDSIAALSVECKLNVNTSMSNILTNYYSNAILYAFCNTEDVTYNWSGPGAYSGYDKTAMVNMSGLYRVIVDKAGCSSDTSEIYIPGIFANNGVSWNVDTLIYNDSVRLSNNILEWDTINHYYRPYDSYLEVGSNAYFYTGSERPSAGSDYLKLNGHLMAANLQTTATDNVFLGRNAANINPSGTNNTAFNIALYGVTSGSNNTAIGYYALRLMTTASNNTAYGVGSLEGFMGGNNTAIGYHAGGNGGTDNGTGNVFIGYNAGAYLTGDNSNLLIIANSNTSSPLVYGEFNNSLFRVNGNVQTRHLIGSTAAPSVITGTGAGTGASVTITGTDAAGRIVLTSGTTPTAGTLVVQTTFNINYGSAPNVVLTPGNFAAAAYSAWYVATFTNMFTLYGANGALADATEYIWFYHVIQ